MHLHAPRSQHPLCLGNNGCRGVRSERSSSIDRRQYSSDLTKSHVARSRDGRRELYFQESHSQPDADIAASRDSRWWTFTARGAAVTEFTPFAARALRVEDVDGDRRPDLVLRSPWVITGPCGADQVDYPGPFALAHALGDGTFSTSDEASEGFIAHQCRERPASMLQGISADPQRADSPANRIGCALWWGRTSAEIAAEIERGHASLSPDDGRCFPKPALLRAANVSPPEAFRLACAPR